MSRITLLLILISYLVSAQQTNRITIVEGDKSQSIPSYNYQGIIYISVKHFADAININSKVSDEGNAIDILFVVVVSINILFL